MWRNEKLLSVCAIWTQFGNALRHIKLKWPATHTHTHTHAARHWQTVERMNGSNVSYSYSYSFCLSHMRLWRCVQPAKLLTFAQKSTPNSQKQTANSKETKDNDNDTGRGKRGKTESVRNEIVWWLCRIKAKCAVHKVQTCVASHRQRFTRTSILLTCPAASTCPAPALHCPWACNRFVAAAANITMPLQQVSQRERDPARPVVYFFSQSRFACMPCLACLLVKFIKYLCGSCLHSFHLAFTYFLSLSLSLSFSFFSLLLAVHHKIAGMLNP